LTGSNSEKYDNLIKNMRDTRRGLHENRGDFHERRRTSTCGAPLFSPRSHQLHPRQRPPSNSSARSLICPIACPTSPNRLGYPYHYDPDDEPTKKKIEQLDKYYKAAYYGAKGAGYLAAKGMSILGWRMVMGVRVGFTMCEGVGARNVRRSMFCHGV